MKFAQSSRVFLVLMFFLYTSAAFSLDGRARSASELRPELRNVVDVTSIASHTVQLLEDNTAALEARLQLIEQAEHYIVLETFIYSLDLSGEWILQALINKKKKDPHVRIRILIDAIPLKKSLDAFNDKEFKKYGIEFKVYNPAAPLELFELNYRNHRKLIASEKGAIVGGRNIADDYYTLAKRKNFMDRDILIRGPIQGSMLASFEAFWNSHHTEGIKEIPFPNMNDYRHEDRKTSYSDSVPNNFDSASDIYAYENAVKEWNERTTKAQHFRVSQFFSEKSLALLQRSRVAGVRALAKQPIFKVYNVRLVSDGPVGAKPSETATGPAMLESISKAERSLIIENGYVIPDNVSWPIYKSLMMSGKDVVMLTNSRQAAGKEIVVSSLTLYHAKRFAYYGGRVFLYSGDLLPNHENPHSELIQETNFATHAKSFVVDGQKCMIGTANFDPRSLRRTNAELAVFIDDRRFCQHLTSEILERARHSELMTSDGKIASGAETNDIKTLSQGLVSLLLPVIRIFERWF